VTVATSSPSGGFRHIVGNTPTPRLLVKGYGEDVAAQLRDLFPTIRCISSVSEVALNEWHALLTTSYVELSERDVHTIVIPTAIPPGGPLTQAWANNWPIWSNIGFTRTTKATIHVVADGLPPKLAELAARVLLPMFSQQSLNRGLSGGWADMHGGWLQPFVMSSDGAVLAGSLTDRQKPCWMLPSQSGDPVPWVRCAYGVWSSADPKLFPPRPDWRLRAEWQTPEEVQAVSQSVEAQRTFEAARATYDSASVAAAQTFEIARRAADLGARRLLTAQGDDLRDAVAESLRELGFRVQIMDEVAVKGDLLEDLRVTDPATPGWTALAEVRGYKGGAQLHDLLRIGRFVTRYLRATGDEPSRRWYVVNGFLDRDPSEREEPLHSNQSEVATFADDRGSVIDTRVLFKLSQEVLGNRGDGASARAWLRQVVGVASLNQASEPR
jgi:hypothetical protein